MSIHGVRTYKEVRVYGPGAMGGKGAGLVKINECDLPRANKLPTHILATDFYDRYRERGGVFGEEEHEVFAAILADMGNSPIGVRSSATNEAGISDRNTWAIHAGENISFMLPNNHHDYSVRFGQLQRAIACIYDHFVAKQAGDEQEKMAIVVNPIPGIQDDTLAGPFYYPYISGVANSFFPHALKIQDPTEGFARIAFGHGYATVLDDFPVISMATIRHPIPLKLMQIGNGQQYFYALDMTKNEQLQGVELETMKKLHVRFANFHKIKLLGVHGQVITIEELIQNNHFGFQTGLERIMQTISAEIASHFQIEFVFNIDFRKKPYEDGVFHVVQLTLLPEINYETIEIPNQIDRTYLSIRSLQGHGIKQGIRYAVVISPFLYSQDRHDHVRDRIAEINRAMRSRNEKYVLIVPGRLGSQNKDWGICVEYKDVDQAVAIFEYGVDIAGRAEPLPEKGDFTGGIYGSHFLYMIQGGYDEEQKRMQARMYGTQGTHFLTNIMSNNIFYGYISPTADTIDPRFFSPPETHDPIYVLSFPRPASIYADSINQRCVVVSENE
ncbi:MAG: hypothetical protein PHR28_07285 [candidate division Zixibacteria bacterium]|nr:hypothetical protein [candidate division Zixibacteria bacterium]